MEQNKAERVKDERRGMSGIKGNDKGNQTPKSPSGKKIKHTLFTPRAFGNKYLLQNILHASTGIKIQDSGMFHIHI